MPEPPSGNPSDPARTRRARTTRRRGRLSATSRHALEALRQPWVLDGAGRWTPSGLAASFGRDAPRLLDIGPGSGGATLAWAASRPGEDVVAVELHRPGVARLLRALTADPLPNVRLAEEDATDVLAVLEPGAFHEVRVLFPDPWPKRRHVGRRLVDEAFVHRVADLLPEGGTLHVATDWDDYARQVRAALAAEPRLRPLPAPGSGLGEAWRSARPPRPLTIYEARGLAAGRRIADLVVRRQHP